MSSFDAIVAFGFSISFVAFFSFSALYSAADSFGFSTRLRSRLPRIQSTLLWILIAFTATVFFQLGNWRNYVGILFLNYFLLLMAHWLRSKLLPRIVALAGGHSDLFNSKLAMWSNFAMFFALLTFIAISDGVVRGMLPSALALIALITSLLMMLKECFYVLRYTKHTYDVNVSFSQILFGEITKSGVVVFSFATLFLASLLVIFQLEGVSIPPDVSNMTNFDIGALAFCSLLGASCPDKWQWEYLVWATNFLAMIGFYGLGIALAAAIGRIK